MKLSLRTAMLLVCGWLVTLPIVRAQESYDVQKGLTPYGSYKGGDLDSVNMVNGNLTLHIPLISFPQRGKSLRLNYFIYANDKQYMFDYSPLGSGGYSGQWWLFGGPCPTGGYIGCGSGTFLAHVGAYVGTDQGNNGIQTLQTTFVGGCKNGGQECTNLANNYYVLGPDDARHYFGSSAQDAGNYYNCGAAVDLSGFVVAPLGSNTTGCTGPITDRDGIVGSQDVDGNSIGPADTLGRVFSTASTSTSSCASGTTSAQAWTVPGSSQPYIFCYTNLSYQTAFNATNYNHCIDLTGAAEASGTQQMLTQVILPNLTYYQFSYDQYLSLTKVTLPTGGYLSYTWQNVVLNCGNLSAPVSRTLASRTKNDGITSTTWHYQWIAQTVGSDPWQNVVTDPMGNDEVHHVNPLTSGTDDEVDYYTGCSTINTQYCSPSSGTELKTVVTAFQYTGNAEIMSAGEFGMYDVPIPETKTTTMYAGATQLVSKTVYTLVPAAYTRTYYNFSADSTQPPQYDGTAPLNSGQIASVAEYDFGVGGVGNLLRTTTTTYEWQDPTNGSAYVSANLFNLPSKVVVTDVNGNQCSEVDYKYDIGTPYIARYNNTTVQFTQQLLTKKRGNVNTTSHWVSNTPCQANATGTALSTTTSMYDMGEISQEADERALVTTHTYDPAYYGAYRTQTQMPNTGSVAHIVSATYDINTGLMSSFTGQNRATETTTYGWDFNMRRIVKATVPDGGITQFCYSDSGTVSPGSSCSTTPPPYQVLMQQLQTGSTYIKKTVLFDELGRSKETQLTSDPAGTDYTDTAYDADGRVATVSNPYRTTSNTTDGTAQTLYDGLGRVTQVTKQDGSITTTGYTDTCNTYKNAQATTVTDEAGNARRTCTDALGRLTEVDEPGPGPSNPATQSTGSFTIGGPGEQSVTSQGNPGYGTITVNSSGEQSTSVPASSGSGWVTISFPSSLPSCDAHSNGNGGYYYTPDAGTVSVTVGTTTVTTSWGGTCNAANGIQTPNNTADSISSTLASYLSNSGANVTASDNGSGKIQITAKTTGLSTNYNLSVASQITNGGSTDWLLTSASGSTLTGGANAKTTYDTGNLSVTVNSTPVFSQSVSYANGSSTTGLAQALASAIKNASGATVTATYTGSTVTLTSIATGSNSNYTASSTSASTDGFNPPSFTTSPASFTFAGGSNGQTTWDSGTVSVTVGTFTAQVNYGQGDTPTSVTNNLIGKLNASGLVTAQVTGNTGTTVTVTLTSVLTGTQINYNYSGTSWSNQSGTFPNPSFTATMQGTGMTGGSNSSPGPWSLSTPYVTLYNYDALGDLLCVEQHGGVTGTGCSSNPSNDPTSAWRVRRFTYDSLSRVLTATNPETGTVTYTYDVDTNCSRPYTFLGLLVSKTDARGIRTCMQYDNLNRVTGKSYSNGDPTVTYTYDSGTNAIGHRTGMTDASGSSGWTYDLNGRVASETHTIAGHTKTISTAYNKDGSINQITYPSDSGTILSYGYDAAGHLTTLTDTAHSITYLQNTTYYPPGQLNQAKYGSAVETSIYNNRLQPCWFYATTGTALPSTTGCTSTSSAGNVLDLKYNFNFGAGDNGNLIGFTNDKDSNRSVAYTYDPLNRLTSATTPNTDCSLVTGTSLTKNWGESFTLDPWGNLIGKTVTKCTAENLSLTALVSNQLSGFGYDAAGDMTLNGGASYTYNGEGQLLTAGGVTYTYDGDGNRVEKSSGTFYWGSTLESDGSGNLQREFVFAGNKRIARRDISGGTVYYYFTDHLGSSSVVTNSSGVIQNESDYYPYGGERAYTVTLSNQNYKFTGKERDTESGLDNFGARYVASSLGRFMTPDWAARPTSVPYAVFGDPQSLNLYGYVRNDPVSRADADGHFGSDDYSSPATGTKLFNDSTFGPNPEEPETVAESTQEAAPAGSQTQAQTQPNQQSNIPTNSRTDVLLYSNEYTPKPMKETAWFWQTTWRAGTCSGDRCSQSSSNEKQTISLVESVNGGAFKPTGDPAKGTAHDQISPEPKTFNQHWFVDGKQVQLVVGKDSKGILVKTWEVHIEIKNLGDRPVYSPAP